MGCCLGGEAGGGGEFAVEGKLGFGRGGDEELGDFDFGERKRHVGFR